MGDPYPIKVCTPEMLRMTVEPISWISPGVPMWLHLLSETSEPRTRPLETADETKPGFCALEKLDTWTRGWASRPDVPRITNR